MKQPILITGCARSGTSMTAGIVSICGAFGGTTAGPNQHNQKGMFENCDIRNNLTKPYLKSIGCDPMGQKPLPNTRQIFDVTGEQAKTWMKKVQDIIMAHGYKGGHWYYKGAKMCLSWYLWHLAFPNAKWIIVRRDMKDIVTSCLKTHFMSRYRDSLGWEVWVETHLKRFEQMEMAGLNIGEVWPSKMVDGDLSEMKDIIEWAGLKWEGDLIKSFIDPKLYGGKR